MPTQQFLHDRERGKWGQQIVANRLMKRGAKVSITPDGYNPGYDLVVQFPQKVFCAEVKADFRTQETGNVALEKEALEHTATDVWFYVIDRPETPEVHLISALKARQTLKLGRSGAFGEHGETCHLIPYQTFKSQISLGQLN